MWLVGHAVHIFEACNISGVNFDHNPSPETREVTSLLLPLCVVQTRLHHRLQKMVFGRSLRRAKRNNYLDSTGTVWLWLNINNNLSSTFKKSSIFKNLSGMCKFCEIQLRDSYTLPKEINKFQPVHFIVLGAFGWNWVRSIYKCSL